jgi:hypothetical protein
MKINYATVKETDKMVNIEPLDVSVNIALSGVKEYYLTPLQAILFGIVRKYGKDNEWVSIPESINGCFMHFEGGRDINAALDALIEKRLIIEGNYLFPFDDAHRVFRLADI